MGQNDLYGTSNVKDHFTLRIRDEKLRNPNEIQSNKFFLEITSI